MDNKEYSKKEYISRINRVTDYIDKHISNPINLAKLAEIAHFSPFHFHRIFTVLTGETPNVYLQRIRLEKAASLLQQSDRMSITEVAYQYGFNSVSLFSRTFRGYFGVTAKEFRKRERATLAHNGLRYSKTGQLLSKNVKNDSDFISEFCSVKLQNLFFMDTKIEIKEMPEMKVVYVRHQGTYNLIGQAYDKLMQWAGPRGLLNFPETKVMTVYQDDPAVTAIEKIRQDACITVTGDVKVEGEIGKSVIAGGKYAVGHFEISETEFEKAWNTMCLWCTESGYMPCGSPYELYYNDASQHPERRFILDICIPVMPL